MAASILLALAAACASSSTVGEDVAQRAATPEGSPTPPVATTPTETEAGTTPAAVTCEARPTGAMAYTLEAAGVEYEVTAYVPRSLDPSKPAPVVLNWHGLGGTGPLHAAFTGFTELAEAEGFVLVAPSAPPLGPEGMPAWELEGFDAPGRDDIAFAEALIEDVIDRLCGDSDRIYSIGMSNGGLFTSRLICELGDRLTAAASVAGLSHPDDCQPPGPVPFMAFHGTADLVIPFDPSIGPSILDHPITEAFDGQAMAVEFAEFAADMGCGSPRETALPPDVIRHDFEGCDGGVVLVFYEVTGGGHTWPGPAPGDGTTTVDATAGSWDFFERWGQADS